MVSLKSVEKQLKSIRFNGRSWGKAEVDELPNILLPGEKISEAVNGMYEGGFALLVGTNIRLLLIDKKPLNYLTVEDMRFDMINQIDYSHRLLGARINISAGSKNLKFTSYNQQRLRKLIGHVQHRMAEIKNEQSSSAETQQQHLERINQQLQAYLLAQHQQQEELRKRLEESKNKGEDEPKLDIPAIRPSPELADYLFTQSLLREFKELPPKDDETNETSKPSASALDSVPPVVTSAPVAAAEPETVKMPETTSDEDLVEAGRREIFGKAQVTPQGSAQASNPLQAPLAYLGLEVNPLRIAYAKLPMALRSRKFGHPSFHAQARDSALTQAQPAPAP